LSTHAEGRVTRAGQRASDAKYMPRPGTTANRGLGTSTPLILVWRGAL
jgi:hypothetical protein